MLNLASYQETQLVYTGPRTVVYRAIRASDTTDVTPSRPQPVVVKVLRNPHPNFNELVKFRNQYVITRHLNHPNIVQPLTLERYGNGYALVMPDEGAIALSDYWPQSPHNLADFLAIAIQLAEALHYLGQQHIIHKDIKPANILIHPETGNLQLIDFSIASLLPKEQQQLINPNVLEGTLPYISPEQTGRMNRGIDYRTDFYSLGVTFFQLLTGKLPFETQEPMELIHCHIARTVQFPADGEAVPVVVQAIVLKLMAKNAEDRYQSALGLKHDLERCLQQLETKGAFATFELGERDACDRFLIPEKLYGREAQVQTLLDAFERVANGATEMMLVAGFSGIGKTAVINEVHKPIVKQRGYFIKGKYDQFNRDIPFSAFVQAFRDLMGQLLGEPDVELAKWKDKILNALGDNAQIVIDVVPELEGIIGEQLPVVELMGIAAQNRFNLLFQKFIAIFATPEHPLVIFLDDLQWADSASLKLTNLLISDGEIEYLLLLGAYRDNEVFPAHPLMLELGELEKNRAAISTIALEPLAFYHINQLVADTLHCAKELAQPLTEVIYQKTQGNPFFATQFLKGLYKDSSITFNSTLGYWECDLVQVRDAALTDDVVEFMARGLYQLENATQNVLKLAACIGNQFDLETLAIVSEQSSEDVADNLWEALQEGLILPVSETYKFFQEATTDEEQAVARSVRYRFLHDRVQQAAYSLIPDTQKQQTHLAMGRLLWQQTPQSQQEDYLFNIVGQLNLGSELIIEQEESDRLGELNWQAAQKAKHSTAYSATFNFCRQGYQLLGQQAWERHYQLTLNLATGAAEAAYLKADFDSMDDWLATSMENTLNLLDKIKLYEIKILSLMARNQPWQSVQTALEILALLGINFPESPNNEDVEQALQQTAQRCENYAIADLIDLPPMTDPKKMAALKILSLVIPPTTISAPIFFPLMVTRQIDLCLQYGNSDLSAYSYVFYGFMLCGVTGDLIQGYQFGNLALQLLEKYQEKALKAKVLMTFYGFISFWHEHLRVGLEPLKEAYRAGLETGDLEFSCYASIHYCFDRLLLGHSLAEIETEVKIYTDFSRQIKLEPIVVKNEMLHQMLLNLMGQSSLPHCLTGTLYNLEEKLPQHYESQDGASIAFVNILQLWLCLLFRHFPEAIAHADAAEPYLDTIRSTQFIPLFYYYDALARLILWDGSDPETRKMIEKRVSCHQKKLEKWADIAPMNYQHQWELVAAKITYITGDLRGAMEHYEQAIYHAKNNGYIHEEALANELAAHFYLDWNKERVAAGYLQEAYYCYARWGAKAKTDQLEIKYAQLLTPILQKKQVEFNALDTLADFSQTVISTSEDKTCSMPLSDSLDLGSLLRAAQVLSSTIELTPLLADISRIILTNAGAEKVMLFIPQNEEWQLRQMAQLTRQGTVEVSINLQPLTSENIAVPLRLIHYVKNTQKSVLIDEGKTEIASAFEGYLLDYQPQSVFCVPLLDRGILIAVLYLEHRTTKGVFTSDRQRVIKFLCTQAAIALQKAQLYDKAQQALEDLTQAQLQLVQSEKMSALGNLVAGVAHEINNPISFLRGNIQPAQRYVQDLLSLIDLYQKKMPDLDEEIAAEIEAIDLDFIRTDLPKLLKSMNLGVDRIRHISNSLRIFSRADREKPTKFNIHEGIDSTLLILKHRTKANQQRPAIEISKNYAELPEIECFPGQLNQVFMNIFANAIDAFDEANQGQTYMEIEANLNRMIICTSRFDENRVKIQIQDNGCGMSSETQERIFDQGFTTKAVGKGTGLGMAIAYQIVTEKHGGTITCNSLLGEGTIFTILLPILSNPNHIASQCSGLQTKRGLGNFWGPLR